MQESVFINETDRTPGARFHAGSKARDDVNDILASLGMPCVSVVDEKGEKRERMGRLGKLAAHRDAGIVWSSAFEQINDDVVVLQFPPVTHSVFLGKEIRKARKRGIRFILIVHDLDILRKAKANDASKASGFRERLEESDIIKEASVIIVHNDAMKKRLIELTGFEESRVISLGLFDYLVDESCSYDDGRFQLQGSIMIAGNLGRIKSGYLYDLPNDLHVNLYGANYEGNLAAGSQYLGPFPPAELPGVLKGSFGLVWDGPSIETCEGVYGDYMQINNPHKTSLYLASGAPVIVWEKAAIAAFVEQNAVGFAVPSLRDIPSRLSAINERDYNEYRANVARLSTKLRGGYYTKTALAAALDVVGLHSQADATRAALLG